LLHYFYRQAVLTKLKDVVLENLVSIEYLGMYLLSLSFKKFV